MGERIPQSYLLIQGYCRQLKLLKESAGELPICTVEKLNHEVKNLPLVKRALEMLSLWGECVCTSASLRNLPEL